MNISRQSNSTLSSTNKPRIAIQTPAPAAKRRRTSASSNDSGCQPDEQQQQQSGGNNNNNNNSSNNKYPSLVLTDEEKRLCEREGVRLPSHYPLSREEEKNLKRIRRKIRNKVSAQDSRKRKKEYVDAMEDRVKQCSEQNDELCKKIQLLESQNRTLAGQLKRLQQIIVNGGLKNSQTSTAMMVLLLSTALFLLPGFNKEQQQQQEAQKYDLDVINQAIKMPPMPGQSRSLLHFTQIKQEFESPAAPSGDAPEVKVNGAQNAIADSPATVKMEPLSGDHDYFVMSSKAPSSSPVGSYIEEDAPPEGYGPGKGRKRTAAE